MDKKLCPYCNKEMIEGSIAVIRYSMIFTPKNLKNKTFRVKDNIRDGEVIIKKGSNLRNKYVKAYRCDSCKTKIIYEED